MFLSFETFIVLQINVTHHEISDKLVRKETCFITSICMGRLGPFLWGWYDPRDHVSPMGIKSTPC